MIYILQTEVLEHDDIIICENHCNSQTLFTLYIYTLIYMEQVITLHLKIMTEGVNTLLAYFSAILTLTHPVDINLNTS